jgi:arylformamidase
MAMTDWTDAYANRPYIPDAETYPLRWAEDAAAFRTRMLGQGRCRLDIVYGAGERNRLDLFLPKPDPFLPKNSHPLKPHGLIVFIHGGYWLHFDKSFWSHFSQGALQAGWAVAIPSYNLAPSVRITKITLETAAAITCAARQVAGPVHLAGHSAGGHLVTRMMCANSPLGNDIRNRLKQVVSISGLHDLRPLMKTAMNEQLQLDEAEAKSESAALQAPLPGIGLACFVGASERPEFLRQNALLANIWTGFGIKSQCLLEAGRHHFDVLDGMLERHSALTRAITGDAS